MRTIIFGCGMEFAVLWVRLILLSPRGKSEEGLSRGMTCSDCAEKSVRRSKARAETERPGRKPLQQPRGQMQVSGQDGKAARTGRAAGHC